MESEYEESKPISNRKRKKLYDNVRIQMEFYFSDSNLAKDKFLYNIILENPEGYVDIKLFKSFNKVKAFGVNTKFIAESLSRSNVLEVNSEKTKVKRKNPIDISKDFDACTLYVERLPNCADQKWLKEELKQFGTVEYINIPRFKITQKIKGFAFIEFSSPESVTKACQFYNKLKNMSDDNISVSTNDISHKTLNKESDQASEDEPPMKKIKVPVKDDSESGISKRLGNEFLNEGTNQKKKHRKKNKTDKSKYIPLRVMSKLEWKNYRNKYLDLQRATTLFLKKNIFYDVPETNEQENATKSECLPKKEIKFQPGVILKIKLLKPVENPSEFKEQIKAIISVAYIDAPLGTEETYIRCHTAEDANLILHRKTLDHIGNLTLLTDSDEMKYWEKIRTDRETTLSTPSLHRQKSQEKIKKQKNKHIYFDE